MVITSSAIGTLASVGELLEYLLGPAVGIALSVVLWGIVFRKAGFTFWLGLLGIVPFVPLLVLVAVEWPVQRLMSATRAERPEHTEEDAYALLEKGHRLMRDHQYEEALGIFEQIAGRWPDATVGQDAGIAIKQVQEKLACEAELRREA